MSCKDSQLCVSLLTYLGRECDVGEGLVLAPGGEHVGHRGEAVLVQRRLRGVGWFGLSPTRQIVRLVGAPPPLIHKTPQGTHRAEREGLALKDPDEDGGEDEGKEAVGEDQAVRVGEVLPVPGFGLGHVNGIEGPPTTRKRE